VVSLLGFSFFGVFFFTDMFPAAMSNSTSLSEEASVSSGTRVQEFGSLNPLASNFSPLQHQQQQQQQKIIKKKRSLPGNPGRFFI
jgi:hypothetical protein